MPVIAISTHSIRLITFTLYLAFLCAWFVFIINYANEQALCAGQFRGLHLH